MSDVVLTLRYRREGADGCTGSIDSGAEPISSFQAVPFHKMMSLTARALKETEATSLVLQRTDREGLLPMPIGKELFDLLKADPVAAIRAMSFTK